MTSCGIIGEDIELSHLNFEVDGCFCSSSKLFWDGSFDCACECFWFYFEDLVGIAIQGAFNVKNISGLDLPDSLAINQSMLDGCIWCKHNRFEENTSAIGMSIWNIFILDNVGKARFGLRSRAPCKRSSMTDQCASQRWASST